MKRQATTHRQVVLGHYPHAALIKQETSGYIILDKVPMGMCIGYGRITSDAWNNAATKIAFPDAK
jgi:hypothetical protein